MKNWDLIKETLYDFYVVQGLSLADAIQLLTAKHNDFHASYVPIFTLAVLSH